MKVKSFRNNKKRSQKRNLNFSSLKQNKQIRDKIKTSRVRFEYSYYHIGLLFDCYDCVKYLNKLPLGVLEESINIFRKNLFSMTDRK